LRASAKFLLPQLQQALRVTALAYAAIAGTTSVLTWLATLQPDFSLYAFVPFTYRMQRRLRALSFDLSKQDGRQIRAPSLSRNAERHHDSVQAYMQTVLTLLLEAPGIPPETRAQVHVETVPRAVAQASEPEFVLAVDDGPLFATRCAHRVEESRTDDGTSSMLDIYVSTWLEPALVPAALSHSLAHGIANHAAEALSTLFYGAVPVSAWRPRCLLNMIIPAPIAARWRGGPAEAAHWVVDTLHRFRAPLVAFCMRPVQRKSEFEADLIAAMMLARVGLDPHVMLELLERAKTGTVTTPFLCVDAVSEVPAKAPQKEARFHGRSLRSRYPSIESRIRHLRPHMERLKRLEGLVQSSEGERNRRIETLRQKMEQQLKGLVQTSRASTKHVGSAPSPSM
jgi:hypothetical protein